MPVIHLGVVDIPYSAPPARAGRYRRPRKVRAGTQTTGDVAGWLEDRYHVMQHFAENDRDKIEAELSNAVQGSIETMMMGGPPRLNMAGAESEIDEMFRAFLSAKTIESFGYPGIPTKAALRGVNHRMAHPYARRAARPSFVDTGLYSASFKTWFEE